MVLLKNEYITLMTGSKSSMRKALRLQTEAFLSGGGEIKQHIAGETGESKDKPRGRSVFVSAQPRQTRTYVNEAVNALDSRKKKAPEKPVKVSKRPKKKIILDDFGEPVREIWSEE